MAQSSFFVKILRFFSINLGTKLISVLIAFVLWVVVLGSRTIEATKEVALEVQTSPDMVVASEVPERITFRLSGPKAFVRGVLDRRDAPIQINLQGQKAGNSTYRVFSDSIRLPMGVKVLSITPPSLLLNLEPIRSKSVPIKTETRGILPSGFELSRMDVRPPQVKIKGARSKIALVSEVSALPIDLTDLRQSTTKLLAFDLARTGIELESGESPSVYLEVKVPTANFKIKNVAIKVLSHYRVKLSEKTASVFVRADSAELAKLDQSKVFIELDLRSHQKGMTTEKLKAVLPNGVGLVKIQPETVEVTLY